MPKIWTPEDVKKIDIRKVQSAEDRALAEWIERMATGRPFIEPVDGYYQHDLNNVWLSRCYNCKEVSMWAYDRLLWPSRGEAPLPNSDLPSDVRGDYDEASTILNLSPRGAAALLRLGIQKLC
ncbi:MAG TPA: hypothetical protein VI113_13010, partial [Alphaproteobacteria bacterium]